MDICVLNPFFYPYNGGTEKVLFEVYSRLSKDHNITILTSAPKEAKHSYVDIVKDLKIIRLKSDYVYLPKAPLPFVVMRGLDKKIKEVNADIYHINNRFQYFNLTVRAIRRINKKIAITIHNSTPSNIDISTDKVGGFYDYSWGKKLIHQSDLITGVSKNAILSTVPEEDINRSIVIYNGVDFNKFTARPKSDRYVKYVKDSNMMDGITVLNTARLTEQKGQIYLLEAISKLIFDGYSDLNLLIIGNGPLYNKFIKYINYNNLYNNIRIIGNIPEKMLPFYYNAADYFAFPSLYEPAGMALMEALSSQLPSLSTKVGGLKETMGNTGLYFKDRSYISLYKKLKSVLDNGFNEDLAKKGRERMVKYHDWDKIAKQYERNLESTIRY